MIERKTKKQKPKKNHLKIKIINKKNIFKANKVVSPSKPQYHTTTNMLTTHIPT